MAVLDAQQFFAAPALADTDWDAGFEGDRYVVIAQLGPWRWIYARPVGFQQRFYHRVYPLPVAEWALNFTLDLFGDLCTLEVVLELRFQPTAEYVKSCPESITDIVAHIQRNYATLLRDAVEREALRGEREGVVFRDLGRLERAATDAANEILMMRGIRCRSRCRMAATYHTDAPVLTDTNRQISHERLVFELLQHNFARRERLQEELRRQAEAAEHSRLEHQRRLLEARRAEEALAQEALREETAVAQAKLAERERRIDLELASEARQSQARTDHALRLTRLELEQHDQDVRERWDHQYRECNQQLEQERRIQQARQAETALQQAELQRDTEQLQAKLAEQEQRLREELESAERQARERLEHTRRLQALDAEARRSDTERLKGELEEEERRWRDRMESQQRQHQERLEQEQQRRELETEMRLAELERRNQATASTDAYLRREIELLVLEKQRAELQDAIDRHRQSSLSRMGIAPPALIAPPVDEAGT